MPPQIKRLLPLFVIFIALFLVVRHFLLPPSFGEYGHYRGASLEENKAKPIHYAGKAACAECHEDMADTLALGEHSGLTCEVCHGPGAGHAGNPDSAQIAKPSGKEFCLRCHAINPARKPAVIKQINPAEHNVEHDCIYCHNPHEPWELRNM